MHYEDLEVGTSVSGSTLVIKRDLERLSPHMVASNFAISLLGKLLPEHTLLSFSSSFANEVKPGDVLKAAATIRGFHPTRDNVVNFSVSLDAGDEPVLMGTMSVWVPSKP